MRRSASKRLAALASVVALALTACGVPDDEAARPPASAAPMPLDHLAPLPVGKAELGPGDRVRARGSTLVVDGRVVDLAPMRVDEFVAVHGGVFFRNGTELWFTDLDRARATGYSDVESLAASPDGRRLAFLDLEHGPRDRFGTPLATSVVYDATTGMPLLASYAGMGDLGKDDLKDLYEDGEPRIIGFDGDSLVVDGATGPDQRIRLPEE